MHEDLCGRDINSPPDLFKDHIAFVVESVRVIEISKGSDLGCKCNPVSGREPKVFSENGDPDPAGCLNGVIALTDMLCQHGKADTVFFDKIDRLNQSFYLYRPGVSEMGDVVRRKSGSDPGLDAEIAQSNKDQEHRRQAGVFLFDHPTQVSTGRDDKTECPKHFAGDPDAEEDADDYRHEKRNNRAVEKYRGHGSILQLRFYPFDLCAQH